MAKERFCLVHSPLVGLGTWALVAQELRARGREVILPELPSGDDHAPYWRQHALAVARTLSQTTADFRTILVGHSGAGLLLPAIRELWGQPVAAYLFVDAGIPRDGKSRLDLLREESSAPVADALEAALAAGERFPRWTEEDLRDEVPDADQRNRLLADLRPQPYAFFREPIPVFAGWPDAPCGYLQFTSGYEAPAAVARKRGWAYRLEPGGHFHMLVEPGTVTDALLSLAGIT